MPNKKKKNCKSDYYRKDCNNNFWYGFGFNAVRPDLSNSSNDNFENNNSNNNSQSSNANTNQGVSYDVGSAGSADGGGE